MGKPLFLLVGPTAVGKSDISIELAKKLNGEIISADSMQIYKYMDIGTAKLKPEDMDGIEHYMIDIVYPDEDFSVAVFRERAKDHIDDILSRNKLPMVVGGTGLYINSLTHNLDFSTTICDWEFRNKLNQLAKTNGNEYVHNMLKDIDKESFKRLHVNDLKRIIRALEVYKYSGKTISEYQRESKLIPIEYDTCIVGLTMDRKKLYDRINKRVDIMMEKGLLDEVKKLLNMGYSKDLVSMQGLGYKEMVSYIEGDLSYDGAVDKLKQSTRHFAKRQLTWFRREDDIYWVNIDEFDNIQDIYQNIVRYVEGKLSTI